MKPDCQQEKERFTIALADGSSLAIIHDDFFADFVKRFAGILGLTPSTAPVRQILDIRPLTDSCLSEVGSPSVVIYQSPLLRLTSTADSATLLCEIDPACAHDGDKQYVAMWEMLFPLYVQVINNGGLPIHGALAELEGQGIIIAGPSGTGKSTLMHNPPSQWKPLCDDEALIMKGAYGQLHAHPLPTWTDYIWTASNDTYSLHHDAQIKALVFLSPSGTDRLQHVGPGEAAVLLYKASMRLLSRYSVYCLWKCRSIRYSELFANACASAGKIPSYRVRFGPSEAFWQQLKEIPLGF